MEIFEAIIILIFLIGIGFIIQSIFRDPVYIFKSFLRGLKDGGTWHLKIISFPIWGPIGIIDKIFDLKIFIDDFEDASKPFKINFNEFDKFLLINNCKLIDLEIILQSFQWEYDNNENNFNLNEANISVYESENIIIVKIEGDVQLSGINALIQYIENSASRNRVYNVKGIFLNKIEITDSYFLFSDTSFSSKLIGKTYNNKKIYVNLLPEIYTNDTIFLNPNIDYFKNFDFDKFKNELMRLN